MVKLPVHPLSETRRFSSSQLVSDWSLIPKLKVLGNILFSIPIHNVQDGHGWRCPLFMTSQRPKSRKNCVNLSV